MAQFRRGGRRRRKVCYFTTNKITKIDYKDVDLLKRFVSDRGKILPRRVTGTSAKYQRELTVAIKSPNPVADRKWGDYFFSHALKKSLEKKGFNVIIQEREHWYDDVDVDINIVLRGLRNYFINFDEINVMWNISHPDMVSDEEYEKYDIVFIASEKHANILKERLNTQVETLFQCTDPEVFFTHKEDNLCEDILFVGVTRKVYRQIVKDILEKGHNVSIYGVGWEEFIDEDLI